MIVPWNGYHAVSRQQRGFHRSLFAVATFAGSSTEWTMGMGRSN